MRTLWLKKIDDPTVKVCLPVEAAASIVSFILAVTCSVDTTSVAFSAPTHSKVAKTTSKVSSYAPAINGTLDQTSIMGVDPKTGRLLWKATAKSVDAHTGVSGGAIGDMHSAVATLYQHGFPEALLTAPIVSGDLAKKIITASGGVVVHTLGKGPKTTVKCDNAVWHSDTNIMIGTGHVVISGPGYIQAGPSFQADTKMQSVMIPAPGRSGTVYATIDGRKWNAGN
jgi:hypothetical protein